MIIEFMNSYFLAGRDIDVAEDEGIEDSDPKGKLTVHPSAPVIESDPSMKIHELMNNNWRMLETFRKRLIHHRFNQLKDVFG